MQRLPVEALLLHEATVQDQKEIVELLIDKGADVNAKNDYGETPLDWTDVDDVDSKEIADILRKHGGKSGAEFSIHFAAGHDNIETIKQLEAIKQHLAAGTDVNAKNTSGQTPLH